MVASRDGQTVDEQYVMQHLVMAWNAFVRLPVQHPDATAEFRHGLHNLQRIIQCRPLERGMVVVDERELEKR